VCVGLSVCLSVGPESVGLLWQNGRLDPNAVWDGEVGSVEGSVYLDGGGDRRREGAVFGVNVGHPTVTSGDSGVVILCREGWRSTRLSSQISLRLLVVFYFTHVRTADGCARNVNIPTLADDHRLCHSAPVDAGGW